MKVHQQRQDDAVTFVRQTHGGSAFDSRRGLLILFGSDTHGRDWTNAPHFFDLRRLEWLRPYPNDEPATYAVNAAGIPVAGETGRHPWAMHTFGALTYDPAADVLVVASYPRHMTPGRFTDALAPLWPKIKRHPTWLLHMKSGAWQPLDSQPVHFFPYATAFDAHRCVTIGYRQDGIYELSLASGQWLKVFDNGLLEWGSNAAFDVRSRVLIEVGHRNGRNAVAVYDPVTGQHRLMPTPGERPARSRYLPLAYHPGIGRTVSVVDRAMEDGTRDRKKMRAETWLYDLSADAWSRLSQAFLPFGVGLNYNLEFDPAHRILLLVADPPGEPVAVWALNL